MSLSHIIYTCTVLGLVTIHSAALAICAVDVSISVAAGTRPRGSTLHGMGATSLCYLY